KLAEPPHHSCGELPPLLEFGPAPDPAYTCLHCERFAAHRRTDWCPRPRAPSSRPDCALPQTRVAVPFPSAHARQLRRRSELPAEYSQSVVTDLPDLRSKAEKV